MTEISKKNQFEKIDIDKLKTLSNQELLAYYQNMREYYLNLPYNHQEIAKQERAYKFYTTLGMLIFKFVFKPQIINKELIPKESGLIFVSNHLNDFDQFPIISAIGNRPTHFYTASTLLKKKRGILYKRIGAVFVDRDDDDSKKQTSELLIQIVLHKGNIFIFPEGTRRNKDGSLNTNPEDKLPLNEFKLGAVSFAQKTGSKIVPLGVNDNYKLFKKDHLLVRVGIPMTVAPTDDLIEVNQKLQDEITNLVQENNKYELAKKLSKRL